MTTSTKHTTSTKSPPLVNESDEAYQAKCKELREGFARARAPYNTDGSLKDGRKTDRELESRDLKLSAIRCDSLSRVHSYIGYRNGRRVYGVYESSKGTYNEVSE